MGRCLTVLTVLAIFINSLNDAHARSPLRIVNGTAAADGEFPYMVELRRNDDFLCGGGIIGPEWILTAGHCVQDGIHSIVYGTNKLYDYGDGTRNTSITVKNSFLHPNFTYTGGLIPIYDVGILQLSEPIPFSDVAQPIQLADDDSNIPFHQQGVLSGWGVNGFSVLPSKYLQKIYLQLLTDEECTTKINDYSGGSIFLSIHDFCSDDYYNGECSGDSGSPFVINGLAYGVVSWSFKPCGIVPGTYSRITNPEYRNWIRSITNI